MGVADIWWGAYDVNNLGQQAKLGTMLIDEIIQTYCARTQALVNKHTGRFVIDEYSSLPTLRQFSNELFLGRLMGGSQPRVYYEGLRRSPHRGTPDTQILLEKGAQNCGFEHILKEPEEDANFNLIHGRVEFRSPPAWTTGVSAQLGSISVWSSFMPLFRLRQQCIVLGSLRVTGPA